MTSPELYALPQPLHQPGYLLVSLTEPFGPSIFFLTVRLGAWGAGAAGAGTGARCRDGGIPCTVGENGKSWSFGVTDAGTAAPAGKLITRSCFKIMWQAASAIDRASSRFEEPVMPTSWRTL